MMSRRTHPFAFPRWLKEKNRGRLFSNLGKSISEVSKDHKEKLGLAPNLLNKVFMALARGERM
jgi:hypothetical protein